MNRTPAKEVEEMNERQIMKMKEIQSKFNRLYGIKTSKSIREPIQLKTSKFYLIFLIINESFFFFFFFFKSLNQRNVRISLTDKNKIQQFVIITWIPNGIDKFSAVHRRKKETNQKKFEKIYLNDCFNWAIENIFGMKPSNEVCSTYIQCVSSGRGLKASWVVVSCLQSKNHPSAMTLQTLDGIGRTEFANKNQMYLFHVSRLEQSKRKSDKIGQSHGTNGFKIHWENDAISKMLC